MLDKFAKDKVKYPEQANNNLHIWELGDLFSKVGEKINEYLWSKDGVTGEDLTVLAPGELKSTFKDTNTVTSSKDSANIIAALNGPMAHIYVRGNNGWGMGMIPDESNLVHVAEVFRLFMQSNNATDSENIFGLSLEDYNEVRAALPNLKTSIDKILIRINGEDYKVFKGYNETPDELSDNLGEAGADYVKAKLRVEGLNDFNRSGDIVLIMKDKTAGSEGARYTTGVACKAWHGSLNPSDSYVPLIVAYPGGTKSTIETILKKDTVCNGDSYPKCKGNWSLTDIVKGFVSEQYK